MSVLCDALLSVNDFVEEARVFKRVLAEKNYNTVAYAFCCVFKALRWNKTWVAKA